jgi:hypothetical protein
MQSRIRFLQALKEYWHLQQWEKIKGQVISHGLGLVMSKKKSASLGFLQKISVLAQNDPLACCH